MFSYKSKMHYEKVLGPSKLFSSPEQDSQDQPDSDSEYQAMPTMEQTSTALNHHFHPQRGTKIEQHVTTRSQLDTQMTPVKEQE